MFAFRKYSNPLSGRRGLGKLTSLKIWAGVEVKPKPFMGGEYGYFWGNTKVRSIY